MDRSLLAVVIPAHNEERTVGEVVRGAIGYGTVIVVDDGSTDRTAELARAAGATVLSNSANLGYDGSIAVGFAEAQRLGAEAVVTMVGEVIKITPTARNRMMSDGVSRAFVRVLWSNGHEGRVPEGGLVRA